MESGFPRIDCPRFSPRSSAAFPRKTSAVWGSDSSSRRPSWRHTAGRSWRRAIPGKERRSSCGCRSPRRPPGRLRRENAVRNELRWLSRGALRTVVAFEGYLQPLRVLVRKRPRVRVFDRLGLPQPHAGLLAIAQRCMRQPAIERVFGALAVVPRPALGLESHQRLLGAGVVPSGELRFGARESARAPGEDEKEKGDEPDGGCDHSRTYSSLRNPS